MPADIFDPHTFLVKTIGNDVIQIVQVDRFDVITVKGSPYDGIHAFVLVFIPELNLAVPQGRGDDELPENLVIQVGYH